MVEPHNKNLGATVVRSAISEERQWNHRQSLETEQPAGKRTPAFHRAKEVATPDADRTLPALDADEGAYRFNGRGEPCRDCYI
jgi:hypothetical protein